MYSSSGRRSREYHANILFSSRSLHIDSVSSHMATRVHSVIFSGSANCRISVFTMGSSAWGLEALQPGTGQLLLILFFFFAIAGSSWRGSLPRRGQMFILTE